MIGSEGIEHILVAIIAATAPTMMAYAAVRKTKETHADLAEKVEKVHVTINSRMDELIAASVFEAEVRATAAERERAATEARRAGE